MNANALRCTVVDTPDGVAALEQSWRRLWASDPHATPFQSFDWVNLWFVHYATYVRRPAVVVCSDGGSCVGLAPLYLRRASLLPPRRGTLMFTGTGEAEVDETFAEYMAPLSAPGYELRCGEAIAKALVACHRGASEFRRVLPGPIAPLLAALEAQRGGTCRRRTVGYRYLMRGGMQAALADLGAKQRNGLRRKLSRLQSLPGFRVDLADNEGARARAFGELVTLHTAGWRERGKPGVFANARFRDFHDRLSAELLTRGQLVLLTLRVADEPIAVVYAPCDHSTCYYYQSGVRRESFAALSPGIMAHLFVAEVAAAKGLGTYDLMLASGDTYKSRLTRRKEEICDFYFP